MNAQFESYPNERRRSPRVSGVGIRAEYFPVGKEESAAKASVKDICIHGICIHMPNVIEVSETISINIFLPDRKDPLQALGVVVWYNAANLLDCYNVGIEFESISEEDRKTLADYVEKNLKT